MPGSTELRPQRWWELGRALLRAVPSERPASSRPGADAPCPKRSISQRGRSVQLPGTTLDLSLAVGLKNRLRPPVSSGLTGRGRLWWLKAGFAGVWEVPGFSCASGRAAGAVDACPPRVGFAVPEEDGTGWVSVAGSLASRSRAGLHFLAQTGSEFRVQKPGGEEVSCVLGPCRAQGVPRAAAPVPRQCRSRCGGQARPSPARCLLSPRPAPPQLSREAFTGRGEEIIDPPVMALGTAGSSAVKAAACKAFFSFIRYFEPRQAAAAVQASRRTRWCWEAQQTLVSPSSPSRLSCSLRWGPGQAAASARRTEPPDPRGSETPPARGPPPARRQDGTGHVPPAHASAAVPRRPALLAAQPSLHPG